MPAQVLFLLAETLSLTLTDQGQGRPYLLLHGGAGPDSLRSLAAALAATNRAVLPTHPGFAGTARPEWLHTIAGLATTYLALLERLDLREVVVVGNSVGGWVAAEIGLRRSPRVAHLVLLDAVGLPPTPASGPITDPTRLAPAERAAYAFHDPARYALAPASPAAAAAMAANQRTLAVYGGQPYMHDPALPARLPAMPVPSTILWGESDRIVTPAYGRQFANLLPDARFELVPAAGHFPQLEQPDFVLAKLRGL